MTRHQLGVMALPLALAIGLSACEPVNREHAAASQAIIGFSEALAERDAGRVLAFLSDDSQERLSAVHKRCVALWSKADQGSSEARRVAGKDWLTLARVPRVDALEPLLEELLEERPKTEIDDAVISGLKVIEIQPVDDRSVIASTAGGSRWPLHRSGSGFRVSMNERDATWLAGLEARLSAAEQQFTKWEGERSRLEDGIVQ